MVLIIHVEDIMASLYYSTNIMIYFVPGAKDSKMNCFLYVAHSLSKELIFFSTSKNN